MILIMSRHTKPCNYTVYFLFPMTLCALTMLNCPLICDWMCGRGILGWTVSSPAVKSLPCSQCSVDKLWIQRDPDQDKTVTEDEWTNEEVALGTVKTLGCVVLHCVACIANVFPWVTFELLVFSVFFFSPQCYCADIICNIKSSRTHRNSIQSKRHISYSEVMFLLPMILFSFLTFYISVWMDDSLKYVSEFHSFVLKLYLIYHVIIIFPRSMRHGGAVVIAVNAQQEAHGFKPVSWLGLLLPVPVWASSKRSSFLPQPRRAD